MRKLLKKKRENKRDKSKKMNLTKVKKIGIRDKRIFLKSRNKVIIQK